MGAQLSLLEPTAPSSTTLVGHTIRLNRVGDRCCDDVAIIGSSKGHHHASLTCAGCGRHRGWLPARAVTFISEARDIFGISTEPLVLRTPISTEEASMAKDARSKPNTGAMFKNDRKTKGDNRPDYTGPLDIDGREFWVSGWIKESQGGANYMSIAIRPKEGGNDNGNNGALF